MGEVLVACCCHRTQLNQGGPVHFNFQTKETSRKDNAVPIALHHKPCTEQLLDRRTYQLPILTVLDIANLAVWFCPS